MTLLDCLHTFCGSCLKEWFSLQATRATRASPNPYTCPSCRAPVRETRPNATVTTLLDMYLKANPRRRRTETEEKELRQKYKPGEQVLPRGAIQEKDSDDERMLAEVREMSLRETGVRATDTYQRGSRHRPAERHQDPSHTVTRSSGQRQAHPNSTRPHGDDVNRQVVHQSSLRSLMSSSDIDSSEMEEEILRLVDEGWLDGIDLNNLDTSQVDELSERIADAYRRRHGHRSGARNTRDNNTQRPQNRSHRSSPEHSRNRSDRLSLAAEQSQQPSRPGVSRPRLLEAYPTGHNQHRRASSEQRTPISPSHRSSQNQAARSVTDLSERPSTSSSRQRPTNLSNQSRRTTDPDHPRRDTSRGEAQSDTSIQNAPSNVENRTEPEAAQARPRPNLPTRSSDGDHAVAGNPPVIVEPNRNLSSTTSPLRSNPAVDQPATSIQNAPVLFVEPTIECNRCGKNNLAYSLHYNCSQCHDGKYNLCLQCYRLGRGCLHWYGFGYVALRRYQREAKGPSSRNIASPPHALIGHQYERPDPETAQPSSSDAGQQMTTQNPQLRLRSGAFCALCSDFANDCFWKCGSCQEGEWGFCTRCVNQGRCCTHPLLPVAHRSSPHITNTDPSPSSGQKATTTFAAAPEHHPRSSPHLIGLNPPDQYIPLTLRTSCKICEYPIPPSTTRFHCPQCNAGDFDICSASYLQLVSTGRITADNGDKGWRRCPSGHRMIVMGFEDSSAGQRRVVVKDLVGGHGGAGLGKDDGAEAASGSSSSSSSNGMQQQQEWSWQDGEQRHVRTVSKLQQQQQQQIASEPAAASQPQPPRPTGPPLLRQTFYPPSGGVGMHVLALWAYWPREEAHDELAFPKGAEIREAEDINGDWFVGCYTGRTGVFPGNYVRVLDVVRA